MRKSQINRNTYETSISLSLNLDGSGKSNIDSGCAFLDHMLTLFSKHSGFDIDLKCTGDTNVDYHHTTEDIGICLGKAINTALGDKKGINRYGNMILPMDEALVLCACDFSGRSFLSYDLTIPAQKVGDFDTELVEEFCQALSQNSGCTLHIKQFSGENSHHIIECAFKAAAKSFSQAVSINELKKDEIPSTKGMLE